MDPRTITGTLVDEQGRPLANKRGTISLSDVTIVDGDVVVSGAPVGRWATDASGALLATDGAPLTLLPNAGDAANTYYSIQFPEGTTRTFVLEDGDDAVDIALLIEAGIPPTDPNYPTLIAYVDEEIAAATSGIVVAHEEADYVLLATASPATAVESSHTLTVDGVDYEIETVTITS